MALHVEAKTGILALTLAEAGAKVRLASCNPLSTDDSVALALKEQYGLEVYAKKGEDSKEYYKNLDSVLDLKPDFVIDDGADLITIIHTKRRDLLKYVKGGNEETTTGVVRLRSMAKAGKLEFPIISVNDAHMKFMFDNRYGTGQSTVRWFHERHKSAHRREEPRSGRIWMVRSWNSDACKRLWSQRYSYRS